MASPYTCCTCSRALRRFHSALSATVRCPPSALAGPRRRWTRAYATTAASDASRTTAPPPPPKSSAPNATSAPGSAAVPPANPHPADAPSPSNLQSQLLENLSRAPAGGGKPLRFRVAEAVRERAPGLTETYVAYGGTRLLVNACIAQADYTIPAVMERKEDPPLTARGEHLGEPGTERAVWWYERMGLQPTFSTWSQITFVHMYMLFARIRMFPAAVAQPWQQHLVDHFFHAAEDRMTVMHRITMRGVRNKYLQDLHLQWRGALVAYDEGVVRGDAALAAALWRNLWMGENVEGERLALLVSWMRCMLAQLEQIPDDVLQSGELEWPHPEDLNVGDAAAVDAKTKQDRA